MGVTELCGFNKQLNEFIQVGYAPLNKLFRGKTLFFKMTLMFEKTTLFFFNYLIIIYSIVNYLPSIF